MPQAEEIIKQTVDGLTEKLDEKIGELQTASEEAVKKLGDDVAEIKTQIEGLKGAVESRPDVTGIAVTTTGEKNKFSFGRMFKLLTGHASRTDPEYGYEMEVFKETEKLHDKLPVEMKLAITSATDSQGAFLIPDTVRAQIMPELEAMEISQALGITTIDGLVGNVAWTVDEGGITAVYVNTEAETSGTESVPTFSQFELRPFVLAAFVPMTHIMLQQSVISLDTWVMRRSAKQIALREDLTVFLGDSGQSEPVGIFNTAGIGQVNWSTDVTGTTPRFGRDRPATSGSQNISEGLRLNYLKLANANVVFNDNLDSIGWAASPNSAFAIAETQDEDAKPLFLDANQGMPGRILGRNFQASSQLASGALAAERLLCGDFSEAILGRYGTIAFAASGETEENFRKLRTTVRAVMAHDVAVVHPLAFVENLNFDVTPVVS